MADSTPAAEFEPFTRGDWERAATEALHGRVLGRLTVRLAEGVAAEPLYGSDDHAPAAGVPGALPYVRGRTAAGSTAGWDVRQRHVGSDRQASNEQILTDLEQGATSVELDLAAMGVGDADQLAEVLRGVHLDLAPVAFRPHAGTAAASLLDLAGRRAVPASALLGELGQDPLGATVDPDPSIELAVRCAREHPAVAAWAADGTRWDAAGVDAAAQVGIVVGNATATLRLLVEAGLSLPEAAGQIVLHVAVGPDQFLVMAQLRALRRCWAQVLDGCGAADATRASRVHATVSAAALTQRDPWVNLLRATSAAFGAAAGGADGITILPFDSAAGAPDDHGRRLARNTQLILQEEAGLHRVIDPGGGSWYLEALTESVAGAAWTRFQEIEQAGGFAAAIRGGVVSTWADREWLRTIDQVAHRRRPITGVSEFPVVDEAALVRPPSRDTLPVRRPAALFERLRAAADAMPERPVVRLATLGTQAEYSARVTFAANLFAAGGLAVALGEGVGEGVAPRLACLCSSDELYAEDGAEVVAQLRAAGAAEVWLAGQADLPGIDRHIHLGCDALAALQHAHAVLGLSS